MCISVFECFDIILLQQGTVGNPWGPVVDGPHQGAQYAFLTEQPKSMREQGRFQRLRVMAGLVKDDGSYFIRKFDIYSAYHDKNMFLLQ
jgi:hypothetical protein